MVKNGVPTPIVDKNGRKTTVYKGRTPKETSSRAASAPTPPSASERMVTHSFSLRDWENQDVAVVHSSYDRELFGTVQKVGRHFGLQTPDGVFIPLGDNGLQNIISYEDYLNGSLEERKSATPELDYAAFLMAKDAFDATYGYSVPQPDDAFETAWRAALSYRDSSYVPPVTDRGRQDMTHLEKDTQLALVNGGTVARNTLRIQHLNPTGDAREDWHRISYKKMMDAAQEINTFGLKPSELRDLAQEFLGYDFQENTDKLLHVRDIREFMAEVASAHVKPKTERKGR